MEAPTLVAARIRGTGRAERAQLIGRPAKAAIALVGTPQDTAHRFISGKSRPVGAVCEVLDQLSVTSTVRWIRSRAVGRVVHDSCLGGGVLEASLLADHLLGGRSGCAV